MNFEGISDRELFQMIKSYCISNKTSKIDVFFDEFTIRICDCCITEEFWIFNNSLFVKRFNSVLKITKSIDEISYLLNKIFIKRTIIPFDLSIKCNLIINYDK